MKILISRLLIYFGIHLINKKEKAKIYRLCLWEIKNATHARNITDTIKHIYNGPFELYSHFPEIYVQKPRITSPIIGYGLWFPRFDRTSRYIIVSNALNLLNNGSC